MHKSLIDEIEKRREEYFSGKAIMYTWDEAMEMISLTNEQIIEIEYRRNSTAKEDYITLDELEKRLDFE